MKYLEVSYTEMLVSTVGSWHIPFELIKAGFIKSKTILPPVYREPRISDFEVLIPFIEYEDYAKNKLCFKEKVLTN